MAESQECVCGMGMVYSWEFADCEKGYGDLYEQSQRFFGRRI